RRRTGRGAARNARRLGAAGGAGRAHDRRVRRAGRPRPDRRSRRRRPGWPARAGGARVRYEEGVELSRHTTLGTGGPARAFARPESEGELEQALRWAAERGLPVAVVGLGSNLLAADEGVDALVLKLGGVLASVEVEGER